MPEAMESIAYYHEPSSWNPRELRRRFRDWRRDHRERRVLAGLRGLTADSNLVRHAEHERDIVLSGMKPEEQRYDALIWESVVDLCRVFSLAGHSGFSAGAAQAMTRKMLAFEPWAPLSGEDSEWNEVTDGIFQNRRCSHVFKDADGAYTIDGISWDDDLGGWQGIESRVEIFFPYRSRERVHIHERHVDAFRERFGERRPTWSEVESFVREVATT